MNNSNVINHALEPRKKADMQSSKIPARIRIISQRLQKWFLASFIIGLATGLAVSVLDFIISKLLSYNLARISSSTFLLAILLPAFGLGVAGVLMAYFTKKNSHGTEAIIKTFHDPEGKLKLKYAPINILASIFTIGFGGSAGLEGPSVYIGGVLGTVINRLLKLFNLESENVKSMMIAGSAAGIAAIFKAPLTGIVFGLEVPYKDDFVKESLIPSLVAAVTSYLVFARIMGVKPLFKTKQDFSLSYTDLVFAAVLGFFIGLAGRLFVILYRGAEKFIDNLKLSLPVKLAFGGALTGLTGVVAILWFGSPMTLGAGYDSIRLIINETLAIKILAGLLVLKSLATIATLASGGAGGIFIPMIMMGGILGAIVGKYVPAEQGHLYPIIGMPSFLAAGYKTPLAAVTFIAETTGSPRYIIPGLIAAAVGYVVSGRISVSKNQRWSRLTKLELMLSTKVSQVMTPEVKTVPGDVSISDFFNHYLLRYRHKSLPVIDNKGDLVGMIAISDISQVPPEKWSSLKTKDLAVRNVLVAFKDQPLADVLDIMNANNVDRMPVVDAHKPNKIVGIISSTDIISFEELSKLWHERNS